MPRHPPCVVCDCALGSYEVVIVDGEEENWCLACADADSFTCQWCYSHFPDGDIHEIMDEYYCADCAPKVKESLNEISVYRLSAR